MSDACGCRREATICHCLSDTGIVCEFSFSSESFLFSVELREGFLTLADGLLMSHDGRDISDGRARMDHEAVSHGYGIVSDILPVLGSERDERLVDESSDRVRDSELSVLDLTTRDELQDFGGCVGVDYFSITVFQSLRGTKQSMFL